MPAILAVSAVTTAPACNNEGEKTTESTTTTTESTTTTATTDATTDATDSTTTGTSTGTTMDPTVATMATETDTGEAPDCMAIPDQATCEATPHCAWPPDFQFCMFDCAEITDELLCDMQANCGWFDGTCEFLVI